MTGTKGSSSFAQPLVWQKFLRFPSKEGGCWVLLGLGSGLIHSSKAEPRGVVVRGSFQTLLTSRASPARSISNWKHITVTTVCFSHELLAFTIAEFTGTSLFFYISLPLFKLGHPRLGLSYLWDFQSTWMCRGASKGVVDTWGFSWVLHFIPCCRQWEMMALFPSSLAGAGSGFLLVMSFVFTQFKFALSIMFIWSWLWITVGNVFYIHPIQICWLASLV